MKTSFFSSKICVGGIVFGNLILFQHPAVTQNGRENINDVLASYIRPVKGTPIQIAPMTKQGERRPGKYTTVEGGIFDAIFKRAGIDPCKTDPAELRGHEGFLEHVKVGSSEVLNKGASRSTFGYFIKVTADNYGHPLEDAEFFALFSYDRMVKKGSDGKDESICATEFFLFDPCGSSFFTAAGGGVDAAGRTNLQGGFAVGADGSLLAEVPLELAQVSNFPGEEERKGEAVRPGVNTQDQGCLVCHTPNLDSFPQSTTPFPWMPWFDSSLVGTWECTSFKADSKYITGGGTGFRVTFQCDGTEVVDYSKMKPIRNGKTDKTIYTGTVKARISTAGGVAKVERILSSDLAMKVDSTVGHPVWPKMPGLGPAGLGGTKDNNKYKLSKDSLEYQTSAAADRHANCTVKLKRVDL